MSVVKAKEGLSLVDCSIALKSCSPGVVAQWRVGKLWGLREGWRLFARGQMAALVRYSTTADYIQRGLRDLFLVANLKNLWGFFSTK